MIFNSDHTSRCGENRLYLTSESTRSGSPPQVRGKLPKPARLRNLFRITPAGAGKTYNFVVWSIQLWDHPRRCGENLERVSCFYCIKGSPPQVRGKLAESMFTFEPIGITPAGAGKTSQQVPVRLNSSDHPRRCGENDYFRQEDAMQGRITPAGAGKTRISLSQFSTARDHPRRCGENFIKPFLRFQEAGSPPQVRGKLSAPADTAPRDGITPAGAGKTIPLCPPLHKGKDHPRRCGENSSSVNGVLSFSGSPPQVRGKPMQNTLRNAAIRITPAGAGKTSYPSISRG